MLSTACNYNGKIMCVLAAGHAMDLGLHSMKLSLPILKPCPPTAVLTTLASSVAMTETHHVRNRCWAIEGTVLVSSFHSQQSSLSR